MQLRTYQTELIDELRYNIGQGLKRICAVAPCGAGKTVLFSWITAQAKSNNKNVLIVVNRQELIEQTSRMLGKFNIPHAVLGKGAGSNVTIASVYSLVRRLDKIPAPDIIILDEAHHAVANTWKKIIEHFKDTLIIGFTATPIRLNGAGLGTIFQTLALGPTVKELIEAKNLAPFEYYAPPVKADFSELKVKYGDYQASEIALRMDKSEIIGDVISHYKKLADGKRAICYCASRAHAEHMAKAFNEHGISAAYIDGDTPKALRTMAIEQFRKGEIKIITNVDLISEGFDVPDMDAVILLRPTQSTALFIQQSMRCMRADPENPDKKAIIIDHVGNVYRHGLPDEEREWSLEEKQKKKKETEIKIRQCPKCFQAHRPAPICPMCGYKYKAEARAELEIKDKGQLLEIKELERKKRRMEVAKARNRTDLELIALKRGYSLRWIDKILEVRQKQGVKH